MRFIVFAAVLLMPGSAQAAPLSLEQALEEAEAASAGLRLQEASIRAADAEGRTSPGAGSPSLRMAVRDLEGAGGDFGPPGTPEFVVRARIPLPRPWELVTADRQAAAAVSREEAQLASDRRRLRLNVTRLYHSIPLLEEASAIADRLSEATEGHLAFVTARRAEGLGTELEWLDSEEERRDADEDRAAIRSDLRRTQDVFASLLGRAGSEGLELTTVDHASRLSTIPDLEGLGSGAPELREADADIAQARMQLLRTQLRAVPWFDWFQGGAIFRSGERPQFEVGGAIDIPFTRLGPERTREAEFELEAAEIRRDEVRASLEADARDVLRDAEAARERWEVERVHLKSLREHAAPILDLADPGTRLQLEARIARAELRVQLALVTLVGRLDRVDALRPDAS